MPDWSSSPHLLETHLEGSLSSLPFSAKEIARVMESEGVKGVRYDPYQCILSKWVEKSMAECNHPVDRVVTSPICVRAIVGNDTDNWVEVRFWNYQHVRKFVNQFDKGLFPQLVEGD